MSEKVNTVDIEYLNRHPNGKNSVQDDDEKSFDSTEHDPEDPEFFPDEVDTERAQESALFKDALRDAVVSKKKLQKVTEYINALHMDLKEGTLKRVAKTNHPVPKLDMGAISEDSDETHGTWRDNPTTDVDIDMSINSKMLDNEFNSVLTKKLIKGLKKNTIFQSISEK